MLWLCDHRTSPIWCPSQSVLPAVYLGVRMYLMYLYLHLTHPSLVCISLCIVYVSRDMYLYLTRPRPLATSISACISIRISAYI